MLDLGFGLRLLALIAQDKARIHGRRARQTIIRLVILCAAWQAARRDGSDTV